MPKRKSVEVKAKEVKEIILTAYQNIHHGKVHTYFGKKFYEYFEKRDGEEVVVAFMKLYYKDEKLQNAILWIDHWIGIKNWKRIYTEHTERERKNNLFLYNGEGMVA